MRFLEATSQHTDKNVFQLQNEPTILNALVAQSKLYSRAKKFDTVFLILYIALPILYSTLILFLNNEWLQVIGAVIAIMATVISHRFAERRDKIRVRAARMQQTIDFYLFSRPDYPIENDEWKDCLSQTEFYETISDVKISPEDIEEKRNWYSDYSRYDHLKQVYYCQRMNIRWETELRKYYIIILSSLIGVTIAVSVVLLLLFHCTGSTFAVLITTFAPFIDYASEVYPDYSRDKKRIEKICELQNSIEGRDGFLHHGKELYSKEVDLQNMIYEHRSQAVMVPDKIYLLFRKKQQRKADKTASMVESR